MSNRPPSSSGGRPRTAKRRPTTGRPTTATATDTSTSAANQNDDQIPSQQQLAQQQAYLDDWDEDQEEEEEDYESEDDGDVFAFVPPDLGPSPATLQNYDPAPYGHQSQDTQVNSQSEIHREQNPQINNNLSGLSEEEAYYFDETTGAVYDSQGRLIRGYNVSSDGTHILESGATPSQQLRPMTGLTMLQDEGENDPASTTAANQQALRDSATGIALSPPDLHDTSNRGTSFDSNLPLGSRRANYLDPRISLDGKSITSDYSNVSINGPVLNHSRSIGNGFPSMDALPETDRMQTSNSNSSAQQINNNRNIGFTAGGGIMTDNNLPSHVVMPTPPGSSDDTNRSGRRGSNPKTPNSSNSHNRKGSKTNSQSNKDGGNNILPFAISLSKHPTDIRRRSNAGADFDVKTPSYEEEGMTLELRNSDDDDLMDAKHDQSYQLGSGEGLVHPTMQGVEVSSRGVRMVELEMEVEEDSPYPEVRASVSNIDDPDMPISTIRMWFLALLFTTVAAGVNMFFVFRYPAPAISPTIVILVAWAGGKLMAATLPYRTFYLPSWMGGLEFSLNPGIFNIKEHALITIMANVSIAQAYAMNAIIVQDSDVYYGDARSAGFNVMFVISSQIIGFSLSGICRRFLVWPASMIWPQNLVVSTILNTLHAEEDGLDGRMTRYRFFYLVGIGSFIWYWVPGFLFSALSAFSWLCWIWPNSTVVNTLFGVTSGLGMSVLTFDWNQVIFIGSPLVVPWWAECNIFAGFVLFAWIISPALYFSNFWYTGYFQINSGSSFDKFGERYNFRKLLAPDGRSFDEQAYLDYSPLYLTATYTMTYWTGFAAATAVLVHTVLYHGKGLLKGFKDQRIEEDDVHAKRMRGYPEVPDWWYALTAVVCLVMALITIEVWDTGLPVWGLLLALLLPVIYILPSGFIFAMTGQQIGTNLTSETIAGYLLPGKVFPNMIFKVYALQGLLSGLNFVQDLKLGHYMKIPPRATFAVQVVGAVWAAVVQVGVKSWMFGHIEGLCSPEQAHNFVCPHASVFYTSSIVWGVIGPEKLFGSRSLYHPIYWALLVGAIIPFPTWLLSRRFPKAWFKFISWPLIFSGISYLTSGAGINYSAWFLAAFIFQFLLRKYNFRWWSKYNFVASGALDAGTVVSSLVLFLAITLPMDGAIQLNWVGNTIYQNTLDYTGARNLPIPPGGIPDYR